MRDRTPTRCGYKGCPVLGYFDPTNPLCPEHATYTPTRQPAGAESVGPRFDPDPPGGEAA